MIHTDTSQTDWLQQVPWLTLSLISGLGPVKARQLLEKFQHPDRLFSVSYHDLNL